MKAARYALWSLTSDKEIWEKVVRFEREKSRMILCSMSLEQLSWSMGWWILTLGCNQRRTLATRKVRNCRPRSPGDGWNRDWRCCAAKSQKNGGAFWWVHGLLWKSRGKACDQFKMYYPSKQLRLARCLRYQTLSAERRYNREVGKRGCGYIKPSPQGDSRNKELSYVQE